MTFLVATCVFVSLALVAQLRDVADLKRFSR